MPIQTNCTNCGREYHLGDDYRGKKVRCKECGTVFPVGAGGEAEVPAAVALGDTAVRASGEARAVPEPLDGEFESSPADRQTRRPGRQGSSSTTGVIVAVVAIVLVIFVGLPLVSCLGLAFYFASSSSPPAPVPVAERVPQVIPEDRPAPPPRPEAAPRVPPQRPPVAGPVPPQPEAPAPQPALPLPRGRPVQPPLLPAAPPEKNIAWEVKPDPLPQPLNGPWNLTAGIPVPFMGDVLFPTAASTYVAASPPGVKDKGLLQVYDLRTMRPVGKPLQGPYNPFTYHHIVLSPDGAYLAARPKSGSPSTVVVWSVRTGRVLHRIEADPDPKMAAGLVDFLGADRLFIMKHQGEFPDPGQEATYQTWDLKTGKLISEFSYDLCFHRKWGGFSPGRKYLAMEETGTLKGYHLLFWDLTAGKLAGSIEIQGNQDPWGQAAGIAFSPDGEEVAMLWRLGKRPDTWGRILSWEVKTGKKLLDHRIGYETAMIDSLWPEGGPRSFQWWPERSGWLLFGHLLVDHDRGAVANRLPPEPNFSGAIMDRRFLDHDHIITLQKLGFDRKLVVEALPQAQAR